MQTASKISNQIGSKSSSLSMLFDTISLSYQAKYSNFFNNLFILNLFEKYAAIFFLCKTAQNPYQNYIW